MGNVRLTEVNFTCACEGLRSSDSPVCGGSVVRRPVTQLCHLLLSPGPPSHTAGLAAPPYGLKRLLNMDLRAGHARGEPRIVGEDEIRRPWLARRGRDPSRQWAGCPALWGVTLLIAICLTGSWNVILPTPKLVRDSLFID